MFSKKSNINNPNIVEMTDFSKKSIPSIIVSDLNIQGDLVSEGAIEIGGKVKGNVLCDHVTVRKGAEITGNIKSKQLIVHGLVSGEIVASNLSISSSGIVRGTIEYGYMSVESGADIECSCKKTNFDEEIKQVSHSENEEYIPQIENILNNQDSPQNDVIDIANTELDSDNKLGIKKKKKKK